MTLRTLGVLVMGSVLLGCGADSSASPPGAATASAASVPPATQGPPPPPLMGPIFRLQVARAFAPQLRFNAYQTGHPAAQNRNEDLFPMGVGSFLREVYGGQARVLVQGSRGSSPGVSEVRTAWTSPTLDPDTLGPYPRDMVGDPPGAAPLYVNVYEDPARRVLDAEGRGEIVVHVEYWIFYPQDRADVQILGVPTQPFLDPFGHQGDWEHVACRVRLSLGTASRFLGGAVEEAYYSFHGDVALVRAPELELVDDIGLRDPSGRHMTVYVSQGKHGSYPQAGHQRDLPIPVWLADYVDFFRGNGVVVDAWRGQLFDLEDAAGAPQEFASPELQAILATSPGAPPLRDWTEFRGRWGTTRNRLRIAGHTIGLASSPTGPKTKSDYGDFGASAIPWVQLKAQRAGHLVVYRDAGTTPPQVLPPPLPVRR